MFSNSRPITSGEGEIKEEFAANKENKKSLDYTKSKR
jgi:hypothetical protein